MGRLSFDRKHRAVVELEPELGMVIDIVCLVNYGAPRSQVVNRLLEKSVRDLLRRPEVQRRLKERLAPAVYSEWWQVLRRFEARLRVVK